MNSAYIYIMGCNKHILCAEKRPISWILWHRWKPRIQTCLASSKIQQLSKNILGQLLFTVCRIVGVQSSPSFRILGLILIQKYSEKFVLGFQMCLVCWIEGAKKWDNGKYVRNIHRPWCYLFLKRNVVFYPPYLAGSMLVGG